MTAALVRPGQQLLKMFVHGHRFRLVDQPKPRTESCNQHAASAAMPVTGAGYVRQKTGIAIGCEGTADQIPIGAEALKKLHTASDPLVEADRELPRQHRVVVHHGETQLRLAHAMHEAAESVLRCVPVEKPLEACHIQFQNYGPTDHR